mmetsp:Transcript_7441/g.21148  ORF Transcript_7441/g.21148 Transcript_7441/m.21148 type:complete len:310 (-) Transcript_7441:498-1427(-)
MGEVQAGQADHQNNAHQRTEHVIEQEPCQSASPRRIESVPATSPAPEAPSPSEAACVGVGVRERVLGRAVAVVKIRDLAVEIPRARVVPGARQPQEGDPDEDATAHEVDDSEGDVLGGAWPVHIATVPVVRVDASVELRRGDDRHDDAAGQHLRPLEAEDEGHELILVGWATAHDQDEQDEVEDHADAVHGDQGQRGQDPPNGVLEATEQRLVERQVVVQDVSAPPERRECEEGRAHERELRMVDGGAAHRCVPHILDHLLLVHDDVRPQPVHDQLDSRCHARWHLRVGDGSLLDHLSEGQQQLHPVRR